MNLPVQSMTARAFGNHNLRRRTNIGDVAVAHNHHGILHVARGVAPVGHVDNRAANQNQRNRYRAFGESCCAAFAHAAAEGRAAQRRHITIFKVIRIERVGLFRIVAQRFGKARETALRMIIDRELSCILLFALSTGHECRPATACKQGQHLGNGGVTLSPCFSAQVVDFAVLDELVGPADAHHWNRAAHFFQRFNNCGTKAAHLHMIFEGDKRRHATRVLLPASRDRSV